MATLLTPGTLSPTPLVPANGQTFTLAELQAAVEGYIEVVRLPHDRYMVVNEDGSRLNLPINRLATVLAAGHVHMDLGGILGPAVVCTWRELEGDENGDEH